MKNTNKKPQLYTTEFSLYPEDNLALATLFGQFNNNLKIIENYFSVKISAKNHHLSINGDEGKITFAKSSILSLYNHAIENKFINKETIFDTIYAQSRSNFSARGYCTKFIKPKTHNQQVYLHNIEKHDINFVIGPSGTGKTYIAAAAAANALLNDEINKIILVRPAVEAGEKLGFLPGDLSEKVDPYLRPLIDAISFVLTPEKVNKLIEKNIIEISPLAYMRGRTLNDSFIILDEAQNSTKEQMKMFLTRIGFGSKVIVTGDISQIDLPKNTISGLDHVIRILNNIDKISFTYLNANDVVRHPIISEIIRAYEINE